MNQIPCKKCPQCGRYNDFTVEECDCGKKLNSIGAQPVDTKKLSSEELGEIDTSLKVYVQKCSACGALSYTDDPSNPVKVCYNCHKTRIGTITPVEWVQEDGEDKQTTAAPEVEAANGKAGTNAGQTLSRVPQGQPSHDDEDDDDDDDKYAKWKVITENINKTVVAATAKNTDQPHTQSAVEPNGGRVPKSFGDDDDDDDDDDDKPGDWSEVIETTPSTNPAPGAGRPVPPPPAKKNITLTAIQVERLTFTVAAEQDIYMLGRSANQGDFLSSDGRVGNEHCYLFFRNGAWFVRDNNSKNGTAVNARDVGLNGECMLSDGDELKLGHHPDSAAFRISIK